MATVGTVEGYLVLTDQFTVVLDRAMTALQKSTQVMKTNLEQMNSALAATGKAMNNMGNTATKAGNQAHAAGKKVGASSSFVHDAHAAYAAAAIGAGFFVNSLIEAQQASDRMNNSLLVGTGSQQGVEEQLSFVRAEAQRLGLNLSVAGQEFGKLTAASRDTGISLTQVQQVFTAVSEASTALGLSSEDTKGALNAIVQMMTKGTVQAEELRGQLGDRLPGAVQIMARAVGVSTGELNKMLEQGKVITAEVLPKFAAEMQRTFSGGVIAGSQSLTAEINRLKTSIFDLFNELASSAGLNEMVRSIRESFAGIVASLSTPEGTAAARQFFEDVGTAISSLLGLLKFAVDHAALVEAAFKAWLALKVAGWIEGIIGKLGALKLAAEGATGPLGVLLVTVTSLASLSATWGKSIQAEMDGMVESANKAGEGMSAYLDLRRRLGESDEVVKISRQDAAAIVAMVNTAEAELERLQDARAKALASKPTVVGKGDSQTLVGGPDLKAISDMDVRIKQLTGTINNFYGVMQNTRIKVDETTESIAKQPKELTAAEKKIESYREKLVNQAEQLKVYSDLVRENGGDYKTAEKFAESYYQILKLGLDPLSGTGAELYKLAKANDALSVQLHRGKKELEDYDINVRKLAKAFNKDWADSHKSALSDVSKFGKAIVEVQGQMAKFRAGIERFWGQRNAASAGADALRAFNKEAEIQDEILARLGPRVSTNADLYDRMAAEIRDSLGAVIDYRNEMERISEQHEGIASVLRDTDWGSDKFNSMADGLADVVSAMGKLRTSVKLFSKESADAWASMLQGMKAVLEASGAFQTGNGGGFGGTSEGNYAAEGSMVGAVIGGIIGAFAGGQVQAGMAIGSAAGGMLGGFIKKGAEEALARVTIDTSSFSTAITKAEGSLGQSISSLGNSISTSLLDIVGSIGGSIESMPEVSLKIRDGVIGVVIGGVKAKFKEMDDAISFAVAELLKQGQISGLDDMLIAALRGTSADSLEGLARDLDAVMKVLSFGMTDSQKAITGFTNELDGLRAQMERMLGDSAQLSRALANINTEEIRRWQSTRDQITGEKRSNAEKLEMLKQDGLMWNAEKALRLAELQQKKADLTIKLEQLKAQAELYNFDNQITNKKYEFDLWKMQAEGKLLDTTGEMYQAELQMRGTYIQASMDLIQAQLDALDQVITALGNMPDIDVPNLHLPNVGSGGNVGGVDVPTGPTEAERRAREIEALLERLKDVFDSLAEDDYFAALDRLNEARLENISAANGDVDALNEVTKAYIAQVKALEKNALRSLGLESVELDDRMTKLQKTLEFLRQQGAITEDQLKELGDKLFADILGRMASAIHDEKTLAMLEEIRYDAMKVMARIEIERLRAIGAINKEQYEYLLDYLNRLPSDLPPASDGGGGGGGGGGSTNNQTDQTDTLLDRLIASIEDLRNTLESYQNFLTSLERGPLSGATLQQQYQSAQADFMQMLAAAQGGDMNAIRDLPGMAEEFLQIASQYLDPASAEYQRLVAMMQQTMGGIAGGIENIIGAAPESALGSNGVLDTIAEILSAMASRWGVDPGWNVGNVQSGGFNWNPTPPPGVSDFQAQGGSGGHSLSSQQLAQIASLLSNIEHNTGAQNRLTSEQTNRLSRDIKAPKVGAPTDGWTGPIMPARRAS